MRELSIAPGSTGRERRRAEKREAIKRAANDVFAERGYVGATTQEIAARAGVAIGTLFLYAPEKRDLLFMIVNDDLDVLTSSTFATVPDAPLLDQLMYVYRPRYRFYGARPELSRQILHEMAFARATGEKHVEVARAEFRRSTLLGALGALVEVQQRAGCVKRGDQATFAWLFHSLYLAEIRRWLSAARPEVDAGVARLSDLMRWTIDGVGTEARA